MKSCIDCKLEKPLDDYYNQHNRQDGKMSRCKPCTRIKNEQYRKAKPEAHNARGKAWRLNNPDKHARSCKNWAENNRDKMVDNTRRWQRKNPEETVAYAKSYRARKMGAEGSHSSEQWKHCVMEYDMKCILCHKPGTYLPNQPDTLTEDHVVALSNGGSDYIDNIQPMCGSCNSQKHAGPANDHRVEYHLDW